MPASARDPSTARPPVSIVARAPGAPPPVVVRLVNRLRNLLLRIADRLLPAPIAMFNQLTGVFTVPMIRAAAELGVADLLADGPRSATELAIATGTEEDRLRRLLRGLASIGVFECLADGRFRQSRLSATLRKGVPGSMRDAALFASAPYYADAFDRLVDNLRTGKTGFVSAHGAPFFEYLGGHPAEAAHFNGAMVALTEFDGPALAAAFGFGALEADAKVCDVGGGYGTLLSFVLARHPRTRGVLFDAAHVVEHAPAFLASRGVAERCEVVAGNFFESVPAGCAVYLLKDILHDWDDAKALEILRTIRKAMAAGARLLVAEMVMGRELERFPGALLDLGMMVLTNDGKQRSEEEFRSLFASAGMRLVRVHAAASPTSWVEAVAV